MSDTHDASNCDAFPLAVGLAQAQNRIPKLEALADKLAEALEECAADLEGELLEAECRAPSHAAPINMTPVHKARQALTAYRNHKG